MELISLSLDQRKEHYFWIRHFSEKYGFKFFKPSYEEVPYASNLFSGKESERLSMIEYFLLGSYIIDMKTNDPRRIHALRMNSFTEEEYFWHKKHNKLGVNRWGTIAEGIIELTNYYFSRSDKINLIDSKNYALMGFNEKVEFCSSIDSQLFNILESIYNESYIRSGLSYPLYLQRS